MTSITDFASLKTAVGRYAWRTGDAEFENEVDGMIQMAGSRLNRKLPLRVMEGDTTLTGTPGSRAIDLPADYLEPIALSLTTFGEPRPLRASIAGQMALHDSLSSPEAWCIDGQTIALDHLCDQAHTFLFRYRKSYVLSESVTTNWLLDNHPDLYLAAVCTLGGVFMRDQDEAARMNAILLEGIEDLTWQESRSVSVARLGVDAALTARGGFNIITG